MQAKGHRLAERADLITVQEVLKARPDLVQQAKQQFQSLGIRDIHGNVVEAKLLKPDRKHDCDDNSSTVADEVDEQLHEHVLHRSFSVVCDIPPKYMRYIFRYAEPATMSKYSVRALVKKGCKEPSRQTLQEYWEFMTDVPWSRLLGSMKQVGHIAEWVKETNELKGRRLRDVVLPLAWSSSGFYLVTASGKDITIKDRFTDQSVVVPGALSDASGPEPNIDVMENFSKMRATLWVGDEQAIEEPIYNIFLKAAKAPPLTNPSPNMLKRKQRGDGADSSETPDKRTNALVSPAKAIPHSGASGAGAPSALERQPANNAGPPGGGAVCPQACGATATAGVEGGAGTESEAAGRAEERSGGGDGKDIANAAALEADFEPPPPLDD